MKKLKTALKIKQSEVVMFVGGITLTMVSCVFLQVHNFIAIAIIGFFGSLGIRYLWDGLK